MIEVLIPVSLSKLTCTGGSRLRVLGLLRRSFLGVTGREGIRKLGQED